MRTADVYGALTDEWQSTAQVSVKVPQGDRSNADHRQQVYLALRKLAEDGKAEWEESASSGTAWWKVKAYDTLTDEDARLSFRTEEGGQ